MAATGANIFILRVSDHQPEAEASRDAIWAVLFSGHKFASPQFAHRRGGLPTHVIEITNCMNLATTEERLID